MKTWNLFHPERWNAQNPSCFTNYCMQLVGQNYFEWNMIIYSVNSLSSLIACYLVTLDKQFFSDNAGLFFGHRWLSPLKKLACKSPKSLLLGTSLTWSNARKVGKVKQRSKGPVVYVAMWHIIWRENRQMNLTVAIDVILCCRTTSSHSNSSSISANSVCTPLL